MIELRRVVRFAVNPSAPPVPGHAGRNGFGGIPVMRGLGRHYAVEVTCRGEADGPTGYLINIKDIDGAVRAAIVPRLAEACRSTPDREPGELLGPFLGALNEALRGRVAGLRWSLSPYYSVAMTTGEPDVVLLRQRFEFSASHRLHVPAMSDQENREIFGKCNHPSGHGHNYQVEPCVAVRLDGSGRQPMSLAQLERLVDAAIIQPLDHKHLSVDVPQFRASSGGVNPSVENIARVCYEALAPSIRRECAAADLRSVTVWETDRTSSTYPG